MVCGQHKIVIFVVMDTVKRIIKALIVLSLAQEIMILNFLLPVVKESYCTHKRKE